MYHLIGIFNSFDTRNGVWFDVMKALFVLPDQSPRSSEEETPVSFLAEEIDDQHPESVSESRHRKYIRRIVRRLKKSPSKSILKGSPNEPQKQGRPLPQLDVQPTTLETQVSPRRPLPRLPSAWESPSSILPSPSSSSSSLASTLSWPYSTGSHLSRTLGSLDVSSDDEPSLETTGGNHGHRESPLDTRVSGEEMAVGQTGLKHYKPPQSLEVRSTRFIEE